MSAHRFSFTRIDQQPLPLNQFAGHPILIVNTASECGYTPQYADLQQLWEQYRDRGLVVIGVPSNDFGAQEPGDETAIQSFCAQRYRVDFPLTCKVQIIGQQAHPFYRWIIEQLGESQAPRWNFHKYLIDPTGEIADMWPSAVSPLAPALSQAIESLLPQ